MKPNDFAPIPERKRSDFWEIREKRYQVRPTILTAQLLVARWHEQIGDPTLAGGILDRLVHNAHRIEMRGDSIAQRPRETEFIEAIPSRQGDAGWHGFRLGPDQAAVHKCQKVTRPAFSPRRALFRHPRHSHFLRSDLRLWKHHTSRRTQGKSKARLFNVAACDAVPVCRAVVETPVSSTRCTPL